MNLEKRQRRAKLIADARAILDKADAETRSLTGEEQANFDRAMADAEALKADYEREERLERIEAEAKLPARPEFRTGRQEARVVAAGPGADTELRAAFLSFLRRGTAGLSVEERGLLDARIEAADPELRALTTGTGASGGYTIPQEFSNRLEDAMKAWGGLLGAAEILPTATGATLPWPTSNDTTNIGRRIAENVAVNTSGADPAFGQVNFSAYLYTSDAVLIPLTLIQDSYFDLDSKLAEWLGVRLGKIVNKECTTGTGASQPRGLVTAATLGKTGAAGQTGSVTFDDLIDLIFAVDPAYRPAGKFMMHDGSLGIIAKLKDGQGRYLWQPNLTGADAIQILGRNYPVVINQDMPTMAANAKSIVFGDLSKYKVRRVKDTVLFRLAERFAEYYQVGFVAFCRYDGNLVDAGTNPVKYYANSAT